MARRRYVSTVISQDTRVNKLATQYGDFAALLYTWMIPHAADDASLPGDPEELMYQVLPGRRDKSPEDVQSALDGMAQLGLIVGTADGRIMFPPVAFYKYQTYIKDRNKRGTDEPRETAQPETPSQPEQTDAAEQRISAQNAVSPSLTSSPSLKLSPSLSPSPSGERAPLPLADAPTPAPKSRDKRGTPTPESFPISDDMRAWADANAPEVDIDRETARFLDRNRRDDNRYKDWPAAWRMWMTSPYAKAPARPNSRAPNGVPLSNEQAKQQRTKDALLGVGGHHATVNVPDEPLEARFSVLRRDHPRQG